MALREDLIQFVRAWLKATLDLTDAQVIPADDKGPRPPLPYLTVDLTAVRQVGATEQIITDTPTVRGVFEAEGEIEVTAYGATACDWLIDARALLWHPDGRTVETAYSMALVEIAEDANATAYNDTRAERRAVASFIVSCYSQGATTPILTTETLRVTTTHEGATATDIVDTSDTEIDP